MSLHWLAREQACFIQRRIIKSHNLWTFGGCVLKALSLGGSAQLPGNLILCRNQYPPPLSNEALKQRSCSFALLKDHRTPLSRAMPLTRGSWSGSSPAILHCVGGSVLLLRAASCTAKHPQHHGAAFPSSGIEDFV